MHGSASNGGVARRAAPRPGRVPGLAPGSGPTRFVRARRATSTQSGDGPERRPQTVQWAPVPALEVGALGEDERVEEGGLAPESGHGAQCTERRARVAALR